MMNHKHVTKWSRMRNQHANKISELYVQQSCRTQVSKSVQPCNPMPNNTICAVCSCDSNETKIQLMSDKPKAKFYPIELDLIKNIKAET